MTRRRPRRTGLAAMLRDRRGASAVEAAIMIWPFLFIVLVTMQMGIYYMTQSALNAGINSTATTLRNGFNSSPPSTPPSASQLKQDVVSGAGGMVYNNTSLAVEIRQLSSLSSGSVDIVDGTVDYGTSNQPLALRGKASVFTFAPGFSSLTFVESSAIVRN